MANIALLCPVHRRHRFLWCAFTQFVELKGDVRVFYFTDRPTRPVIERMWKTIRISSRVGFEVEAFSVDPIVEGPRGDFPAAWSRMVDLVEATWPEVTHMGIWDDDMILTDPDEASAAIEEFDLVYGRKLFLWDDIEHYNARLEHHSVVFWRHRPGDRFHPKEVLQVHAPQGVHDDPASKRSTLETFVLDYGFLDPFDRKQVFEREIRTGKIDNFTKPLVEEPLLRALPDGLLERSRQFSRLFAPK